MAAAAAMEQEQQSIEAQMVVATQADDFDRLEDLRPALRALPQSIEESRAHTAAAEERAVKKQFMDRRVSTLPQR